jgi:hypothetical protein
VAVASRAALQPTRLTMMQRSDKRAPLNYLPLRDILGARDQLRATGGRESIVCGLSGGSGGSCTVVSPSKVQGSSTSRAESSARGRKRLALLGPALPGCEISECSISCRAYAVVRGREAYWCGGLSGASSACVAVAAGPHVHGHHAPACGQVSMR